MNSNLPGSPAGSPRRTMASGGSQGCEEEEEEEALKKLIVRLNNVQEGKQIETLLQLLEDMLVFTYSDRGNACSRSFSKLYPALGVLVLGTPLLSFRGKELGSQEGRKDAEDCDFVFFLHFPLFQLPSYLKVKIYTCLC